MLNGSITILRTGGDDHYIELIIKDLIFGKEIKYCVALEELQELINLVQSFDGKFKNKRKGWLTCWKVLLQ